MRENLEKNLEKAVKEYKENAMHLCAARASIMGKHEIDEVKPWVAYMCTIDGFTTPVIVVIENLLVTENTKKHTELFLIKYEEEKVYSVLSQHNINSHDIIKMIRFRTGD